MADRCIYERHRLAGSHWGWSYQFNNRLIGFSRFTGHILWHFHLTHLTIFLHLTAVHHIDSPFQILVPLFLLHSLAVSIMDWLFWIILTVQLNEYYMIGLPSYFKARPYLKNDECRSLVIINIFPLDTQDCCQVLIARHDLQCNLWRQLIHDIYLCIYI